MPSILYLPLDKPIYIILSLIMELPVLEKSTLQSPDYDLLTYNLMIADNPLKSLEILQSTAGFLLSEVIRIARNSPFDAIRLKALQIVLNKILPDITESRLQIDVRSPYERIMEELQNAKSRQKIALPHKQTTENIGNSLLTNSSKSTELPKSVEEGPKR